MLLTGEDFQANLAGLGGVGTASFGDANSTTFTKGLIPQITSDGNVQTYSAGTLDITELENLIKDFQKNRGSREMMVACGHDLKLEFDAMIYDSSGVLGGGVLG